MSTSNLRLTHENINLEETFLPKMYTIDIHYTILDSDDPHGIRWAMQWIGRIVAIN